MAEHLNHDQADAFQRLHELTEAEGGDRAAARHRLIEETAARLLQTVIERADGQLPEVPPTRPGSSPRY